MAKYVQANAKKSFAETLKHTHETGGGPAPQALDLVWEQMYNPSKHSLLIFLII